MTESSLNTSAGSTPGTWALSARERGLPAIAAHAYYPWFDWLRAVCACTVMLYHDRIFGWDHAGNFAVQVFFALSGWLIGGMLLETQPNELPKFYFNRAIRIWVPYYISAALPLGLSLLRQPITSKWIEIVIYKLTFVYNVFGVPQFADFHDRMPLKGTLTHFWSVNAEEQFYLLAPIVLVVGARWLGRSPYVWSAIACASLYLDITPAIVLGVLAAVIVRQHGPVHLTVPARATIFFVLGVCVAGLVSGVHYDVVAPIAGLCIVLALAVPGPRHAFGDVFGGMSYPLYLNQWIGVFAFNFLFGPARDSAIRHVLSAVGNVAFAIAMYWFVDRRLLANRRAWFTPRRGAMLTAVGYGTVVVGISFGLWMMRR